MHKVVAQNLSILPRQTARFAVFTKLLGVSLDHRFNNVLLASLQDSEQTQTEEIEFVCVRIGEALEPVNARYVGSILDNAGHLYVFALRDSERFPMQKAEGAK